MMKGFVVKTFNTISSYQITGGVSIPGIWTRYEVCMKYLFCRIFLKNKAYAIDTDAIVKNVPLFMSN